MEKQYYDKQRLWQTFLATCDCEGRSCAESFDLTMMHGNLYDRLLEMSRQGQRPVVQHLVLQPHKLAAAYPSRLRMYAHMALVLPRSLALLHTWWLVVSEELAGAMHHLSQGVPLALDPDSREAMRVEPDIVIRCALEESDEEAAHGSGKQAEAHPGDAARGSAQEETPQLPPAGSENVTEHSQASEGPGAAPVPPIPDPVLPPQSTNASNATSAPPPNGGKSEGGGRKRRGSSDDDDVRPFRCVLLEAAGRRALLQIPPPPPSPFSKGRGLEAPPPPPTPAADEQPQGAEADAQPAPAYPAGAASPGGGASGEGAGHAGSGTCSADGAVPSDNSTGSCPSDLMGAGATGTQPGDSDEAGAEGGANGGAVAGPGGAAPSEGSSGDSNESGSAGSDKPGGGKEGRGRRRWGPGGRGRGMCHNIIYIRPPRKAEVSEHVRDRDASPLGLPPLELLAAALPRAATLAGWAALPHVMMARYVLLMAPPALGASDAKGAGAAAGGAAGGDGVLARLVPQLPQLQVGTLMMLAAGCLLATVELLVVARVVSELWSRSRPRRSWARRRAVAWRVVYEAMLQPLREALLSWNITHFVALPLLRFGLPPCVTDVALLLPLAYCVGVLGAGNSDVAARASRALLRVARRARQHEGGYQLLLFNVAEAADPRVIPRAIRALFLVDAVGASGRAAVQAALLEEAPGLAAALAAEQQRAAAAAAAAAAGGGGGQAGGGEAGGELAAAMAARVAPAVERGGLGGGAAAGGGGLGGGDDAADHEYDSEEDEEQDASGRAGGPVVLRWPAPLQLPAEAHDWEDVPRGFTCAITQHLMSQPAMLVSPDLPSAPTYERSAIQKWLAGQMRDPKSNTPLRSYSLLPNEDLHRAIDDWVAQRLRASQSRAAGARGQGRRRKQRRGDDDVAGEGEVPAGLDAAEHGPTAGVGHAPACSGSVADHSGADGEDSEASPSCSNASGQRTKSGTRQRGGSVLSSLAAGASSLIDTGVEVVSRSAAAVAAAAAATAGGGRRRRGGSHELAAGVEAMEGVAEGGEEGDEADGDS